MAEDQQPDVYSDIADDLAAVLGDPSAFAALLAAIDADIAAMVTHQQAVTEELVRLAETVLPQSLHDVDCLVSAAEKLEVTFGRIDALEVTLAGVQHIVAQLQALVAQIMEPVSVRERATSVFKMFSSGSSTKGEASARATAVWGRVPTQIVIEGCSPKSYHLRLRELLQALAPRTD